MPVLGTNSASRPVTWGSISRSRAPLTGSTSMPFSPARSRRSRSRLTSSSVVATTSLPTVSNGMPWASQKSLVAFSPARHSWALSEPGA